MILGPFCCQKFRTCFFCQKGSQVTYSSTVVRSESKYKYFVMRNEPKKLDSPIAKRIGNSSTGKTYLKKLFILIMEFLNIFLLYFHLFPIFNYLKGSSYTKTLEILQKASFEVFTLSTQVLIFLRNFQYWPKFLVSHEENKKLPLKCSL